MKRNASLDIIRGFAVVLVACLHSIGNGSLTANHSENGCQSAASPL